MLYLLRTSPHVGATLALFIVLLFAATRHRPLAYAASACFDFNGGAFAACGTPDEYFFWDSIHLTTAAYSMLAGELAGVAAAPVPEPSAAAMLVAGGVLLLLRRRRIRTATT